MWTRTFCSIASMCATAGAAQAQDAVRLYGVVDAYVGYQHASGTGSRTVLNSGFNPNAFGIAGTERISDSLIAGFVLEGQPNLDTGAMSQGGKIFGRQALVSLAGGWGKVGLGRQHTPGRTYAIKYSSTGWLATDPFGNLQLGMGSAISAGMNADTVGGRLNNSISYVSPKIGGLGFSAIQSFDERGSFAAGQARMTQLGVSYEAGKLEFDLALSHIPRREGSQLTQTDIGLGATYNAGWARFQLAYQAKRGYAIAAASAVTELPGSRGTDQLLSAGVTVPLSERASIGAGIARLTVADAHVGAFPANVSPPFSSVQGDATAWGLSYTYSLSKRTSLFAAYGQIANRQAANYSFALDMRPSGGGHARMVGTGVRHSF